MKDQSIESPVLLSTLDPEEQVKIIQELQPKGEWQILIDKKPGDIDLRFEKVAHLTFFKSS
jgi:hypothetical protein